jgi:hypothetical protein
MPATVLFFEELTLYRGGASYTDNGDTAERVWRITYADMPEDHDEIRGHASLPAIGDLYKSGDTRNRRLKDLSVYEMDGGLGFMVIGKYERPTGDLSYTPDPLTRPDKISGDFGSESASYEEDADGDLSNNTAGILMDPLPTRKVGTFKFKITGNRATTTDLSLYASYLRPACSYNSGSVTIKGITFAAAELLLTGITFEEKIEGSYEFFEMSWTAEVNPDGWDQVLIPSRGFEESPFYGVVRKIVKGEPPAEVSQPWPLDASGVALANSSDTPANVTRKPYYERNFSIFGWTA